MFRDHGHAEWWDDETRTSCGACALAGYGASTDEGRAPLAPNYAGWARAYVQAVVSIPAQYRDAFNAERLTTDNDRYRDALAADIATYGVFLQGTRQAGNVITVTVSDVEHYGSSVKGAGIWQLTTSAGTFRTRAGSSYLTSSDVKRWAGRAATLYLNGRGTVDRIC